ncbi:MAG: hypothetical protein KatS3mg103_0105 [Phycisphaerales bacterium]|nr:MAG: hypothetical protein KatS3mg103_0105 [Phycisphaerales bacterium]
MQSSTTTASTVGTGTLERLRRTLREAYAALPLADRPVALIDLPSYLNIGDSLISLGEMDLLRKTHPGMRSVFYGSIPPDSLLRVLNKMKGVVLIHGGGNFGDTWPKHQELREHLARSLPDATIIQLPQSVHFRSAERREDSMRVLAEHGDFHIMVRDRASYDQLAAYPLASLRLLPDSAFALELPAARQATHDLVVLRRQDSESAHGKAIESVLARVDGASALVGDWANENHLPVAWPRSHRFMARMWSRLARRATAPTLQRLAWYKLSEARMNLGPAHPIARPRGAHRSPARPHLVRADRQAARFLRQQLRQDPRAGRGMRHARIDRRGRQRPPTTRPSISAVCCVKQEPPS